MFKHIFKHILTYFKKLFKIDFYMILMNFPLFARGAESSSACPPFITLTWEPQFAVSNHPSFQGWVSDATTAPQELEQNWAFK